ncbi:MAG: hypothetical protein ACFFED_06045 [Candidatus Thorarchaeota archaeon]
MILQFVLLDDPFWPLLIALAIFLLVVGSFIKLQTRKRDGMVEQINQLLLSRPSVSLTELIHHLDTKRMDRKTLTGLIQRSNAAIMSFSKTSVISSILLSARLKENLVNNSIIYVDKEANRWDVAPNEIERIVGDISQREGLDVLLTKDGDYLLVPDLKDRIRESLELQGRADIIAESQRLRVDVDELVQLVRSWGWYVWQSSAGSLYSVKWLLDTLERSVARTGYLDLDTESTRLDLTPNDIMRVVSLYKWDFVEAFDNRIIPAHLLQEQLLSRLERFGSLNINEEANRLKISPEGLQRVLKKLGLTLITTHDGSVMTLEQIRQELLDDADLAGIISAEESAGRLGIEEGLASRILGNHSGVRKLKDGRYASYRALRSYILEEVRKTGIIYTDKMEKDWLVNRIELAALLKRFGLKITLTKSGNYLSISWLRRRLGDSLQVGEALNPSELAQRYDTEINVIESIVATIQTDTLIDGEGMMISRNALYNELESQFHNMGILRPYTIASERGLDIADIQKTLQPLTSASFRTEEDAMVSKIWLLRKIQEALKQKGIFDLTTLCEGMQLNYDIVHSEIESRLSEDDRLLESCGVIVAAKWIAILKNLAKEEGSIDVTKFAASQDIPKKSALCVLRALLQGVYLPSNDSYFTKT